MKNRQHKNFSEKVLLRNHSKKYLIKCDYEIWSKPLLVKSLYWSSYLHFEINRQNVKTKTLFKVELKILIVEFSRLFIPKNISFFGVIPENYKESLNHNNIYSSTVVFKRHGWFFSSCIFLMANVKPNLKLQVIINWIRILVKKYFCSESQVVY